MSTYLLLDLLTLLFPLALSFDRKVAFYKNWKYLFPAIFIMSVVFLIWDHFFTILEVWRFNEEHVMDWRLWDMPLEEYLFFFVAPYACVFIYECIKAYFPKDYLFRFRKAISVVLLLVAIFMWFTHFNHIYTAVNGFGLSIILLILLFFWKNLEFMGWFYQAYLISLIPFAIINGFLTGLPVLIYNDAENLGIRVGSIPLDDFFYNLLMLLLTVTLYEYFKKRYA